MTNRRATLLASTIVFLLGLTVYGFSRPHIPDTPWLHGVLFGVTAMSVAVVEAIKAMRNKKNSSERV